MGFGHFLRLKGRTSFFRRRIPEGLRARLAQTEICATLGVVDKDSAERGARRLAVAVDVFFASAMRDMSLNSSDLTRVISTTIEAWRESDERHDAGFVLAKGRTPSSPRDNAELFAELADTTLQAHGIGQSLHDADYVSARFAEAGIEAPPDPLDLQRAGHGLTLGLASYYLGLAVEIADRHDLRRGWRGLPVEHWRAHHNQLLRQLGAVPDGAGYRRAPDQADQLPAAALQSSKAEPLAPREALAILPPPVLDQAGPLFSAVMAESLEERIATKELVSSARHEAKATTAIWIEVCGDRPIATYGRADMSAFRSMLVRLPQHYWRSEAEKAKSIRQVIAEAEAKDRNYIRVSNVTINKHLSRVAPFFDWCVLNGRMDKPQDAFWTGFHLPTGVRVTSLKENEERPAWSHEQIRQIFLHPVWTGRKSAYFYNSAGSVIVRDALYWCPLIAAYGAMRREEFAQLKVKHVRKVHDVWVFDLRHIEVDVKNDSSPRYVPLHKVILDLGFIEEMVAGRGPDERLFVELKPSESHHAFGDSVGNRFSRVIDTLGLVLMRTNGTEADGVFHPFRHRLITDLMTAGVPGGIVDGITGHASDARKTERSRYTEDAHVRELKAAVDRLKLPIDVELLARRWKQLRRPRTAR